MPEFWRATSITNQLNRILVPCTAQSFRHGSTDQENACGDPAVTANHNSQESSQNFLQKALTLCKDFIKNSTQGFSKTLRNVIKTSFNLLQPVKTASAAQDGQPSCIKIAQKGKEGQAPYCALPSSSLGPGDSCTNNQNVVCTFRITYSGTYVIRNPDNPQERQLDDFDSCTDEDQDGNYNCTVTVRIWPVFRIPWLSEIWNNTLYSSEREGEPDAGVGSKQVTGRPGLFGLAIPKAVEEEIFADKYTQALRVLNRCTQDHNPQACTQLIKALSACINQNLSLAILLNPNRLQEALTECSASKLAKNLPGQTPNENEIKERLIGGTKCGQEFFRDIALKPKALQKHLGIEPECKTTISNL